MIIAVTKRSPSPSPTASHPLSRPVLRLCWGTVSISLFWPLRLPADSPAVPAAAGCNMKLNQRKVKRAWVPFLSPLSPTQQWDVYSQAVEGGLWLYLPAQSDPLLHLFTLNSGSRRFGMTVLCALRPREPLSERAPPAALSQAVPLPGSSIWSGFFLKSLVGFLYALVCVFVCSSFCVALVALEVDL